MPSLSPTMTHGNIIRWYVKEGDEISPGTVLADIETDKATLAFENQEDGFIAKILVEAGTKDIPVGKPVAIIVEEEADVAAFANYTSPDAPAAKGAAAAAPEPAAAAPKPAAAAASTGPANSRMGPAARYALAETGLSSADVTPTGPNNMITKADVMKAAAGGAKPKPAPAAAAAAANQPPKAAAAAVAPAQPKTPPAAAKPAAAAAPKKAAGGKGPQFTDVPTSQVRAGNPISFN